ncbi:MAG: 50S ribosome-binding GTPase [Pirellulaceae bacterium]|nr:50S ribosome-binding GTPase [Pirellulaceae bacterium]
MPSSSSIDNTTERPDRPIASLLTPPGLSAIATIGLKGERAPEVLKEIFSPAGRHSGKGPKTAPSEIFPLQKIVYGSWRGPNETDPQVAQEDIIVTQLESGHFELHCHGGNYAPKKLLATLAEIGCQIVPWEEWLTMVSATTLAQEVTFALTKATTLKTAKYLLPLENALISKINEIGQLLEKTIDRFEKGRGVDDKVTEKGLCDITTTINELLETFSFGFHLVNRWRVGIAGWPNVGKSSLLNTILGFDRTIVHESAGTTRDLVTATSVINGWPIEFVDTAGIRTLSPTLPQKQSQESLEAEGISLAQTFFEKADLLVRVFDATLGAEKLAPFLNEFREGLLVFNKIDLLSRSDKEELARSPLLSDRSLENVPIWMSAQTGEGLDYLFKKIESALLPTIWPVGTPILFTHRQRTIVQEVLSLIGEAASPIEPNTTQPFSQKEVTAQSLSRAQDVLAKF